MKRRTFLKAIISIPFVTIPSIALPTIALPSITEPKKNLYVEVSARRAGKTKRLVEHMINYIDTTGNKVYFTSGSRFMTSYIKETYVPKKYHEYILPMPKTGDKFETLMAYYDEADLYENYMNHKDMVLFFDNAYYVGTPMNTNGLLYKAYQEKGKYTRYLPYYDLSKTVEELKLAGADQTYINREFYGLWN